MDAQTFDGIDACGERLAEEVRQYVAAHPSLARITVVGHSMGGLIARYTLGAILTRPAHVVCYSKRRPSPLGH